MEHYVEVVGWEEFQHYKDRDPVWIKLHRTLLDNYEYSRLQDASKSHLIGIWLLAARHKNRIPADVEWIEKRIGATSPVDLQVLVNAGLIRVLDERGQDASISLALARSREERRGEENRKEKDVAAAPRRKGRARNTPPATLDEAIDDLDHEKPAVAEQREEGASKSVAAVVGRVTWLTPFQEAWDAAYGAGSFAAVAGHAAKVFRPQKDRPRDEIWRAITNYAKATDPQYATPTGCARTWGAWAAEPAEDYLPVNGWMTPEMDRLTRPA